MDNEKVTVGITLGDYNGIGPEVILKTLEDERILRFANVVVYGQRNVLSFYAKLLKIQNLQWHEAKDIRQLNPKLPNVFNCWTEQVQIQPGQATNEAGARALLCLNTALKDLKDGAIDLLVTGPVNKSLISQHHPDFKGQTEYIAEYVGTDTPMMILADERLRVGLVTNHLSLKDVSAKIDVALVLSRIEALQHTLKKDFLIHKPRIAVLGLNPHAGDNSLLGKEEKDIIAPAVNRAKEKGILALGPFAADGFFGAHQYTQFDGVLAMYHDQGLIPFKTISFGSGVNFTAGISVVRTSPDHGTAYDIAGKNLASSDSLRSAIFMGIDILRNRNDYAEMTSNPVERIKLEKE